MIIILGGSGYVGSAFQRLCLSRGIDNISLSRDNLDYSDIEALLRFLREKQPEFLINAAGYTGKPNVDACEQDKANCLFGNAVLPGRIAVACAEAGIPWGHVSSGCIYSGSHPDGSGFSEEDMPNFTFRQNNCSFYSGTKALGEEVLQKYDNVFIWRLRIPFGHRDGSRNYISKLLRYDKLLDAKNSISHLDEFVAATLSCWEKRVPFGIYNVTNPGHVTTREITKLMQKLEVTDKEFKFYENETAFMKDAVVAPRSNCILSTNKLEAVGINMTPVEACLENCLKKWQSKVC